MWLMQDPPDTAVWCADVVLAKKAQLGDVLRGFDGEWQLFSTDDGDDEMVTVCLADMVEAMPQLIALAHLPVGLVAHWDGSAGLWALQSLAVDPADEYYSDWASDWTLSLPPDEDVYVTSDLAHIALDHPERDRRVIRVYRDAGDVVFEGFHAEEDGDLYPLKLRDVVALYPQVIETLVRTADLPMLWDDKQGSWVADQVASPQQKVQVRSDLRSGEDVNVRRLAPDEVRDALLAKTTKENLLKVTRIEFRGRYFMRCLLHVAMSDGASMTQSIWVESSKQEFDFLGESVADPERVGRNLDGVLANSLEPWGDDLRGAQVVAVIKNSEWQPEIVDSSHERLREVITKTWPRDWVLSPFQSSPTWAGRADHEHN